MCGQVHLLYVIKQQGAPWILPVVLSAGTLKQEIKSRALYNASSYCSVEPRVQGVQHQMTRLALLRQAEQMHSQHHWHDPVACFPAGAQLLTVRAVSSSRSEWSSLACMCADRVAKGSDPGQALPEPPPSSPTWCPPSCLPHLCSLRQQPQLRQPLFTAAFGKLITEPWTQSLPSSLLQESTFTYLCATQRHSILLSAS